MRFRSVALGASLLLPFACARPNRTVSPAVLAAADPKAPESTFTAPADTLAGRPRTLDLNVEDPRGHRTESAPEIGSEEATHAGHDSAPAPGPSPTPKPSAPATPGATPGHSGHDHSGRGAATPAASPRVTASPKPTPKPDGTIYTCPMHPEVRSDEPGTCPKCNMKLEPVEEAPAGTPKPSPSPSGHESHGGHR